MAHTVGIIANPRAGKDIRRLVGHAAAPSDTSRIADIRRLIVGAIEGGAERILVAKDAQGLSARAVGGLNVDIAVALINVEPVGTGQDSADAAAAMRDEGAGVLIAYGGDGTRRQLCRGWRDAPVVALSGGTNNAFGQVVEATVAGAAAGLAVAGGQDLSELIAYQSLVIDIDVDGVPADIALVDAAVLRNDTGGTANVWNLDRVDQILTAVAEPWSVGLSSFAGLVAPTSRTDDRSVLLQLDESASQRVRAPIAPGRYDEAGLQSVAVVEPLQAVTVAGPVVIAVDGERSVSVAAGETATMTVRRNGLKVIDIRRTFSLAVRRGHFLAEQNRGG